MLRTGCLEHPLCVSNGIPGYSLVIFRSLARWLFVHPVFRSLVVTSMSEWAGVAQR
jgi:hypothetical protein